MGDPVCQLTATRMSNHPGDGCGHAVQQKTNHHSVPTGVVVVFLSLYLSLSLSTPVYLGQPLASLVVVLGVVVVAFSLCRSPPPPPPWDVGRLP